MFLGYQINEQGKEFITSIANTKEELESIPCVKFSKIEETKETYKKVNNVYVLATEAFMHLKEEKRAERDALLAATDKYMLPDYPITEEERNKYKNYRKYLRDITKDNNFPNITILKIDEL